MEKELKNISKLMSLVLRHKPNEIGLTLDNNGWANVNELISEINIKGYQLTYDLLQVIVETNDKKRFALSNDKTLIRANQGHSIDVDVNLIETTPPEILFHGTAIKYIDSIKASGIQKQSRQHVHLSKDIETAKTVGSRHGKPLVLFIDSKQMVTDGFKFYLSENNVWLTDIVPAKYIRYD